MLSVNLILFTTTNTILSRSNIVAGIISFSQSAFVIMHPNLEHTFINSNLFAELFNNNSITPVHSPPQLFRKHTHPLLLFLTKPSPEPLSRACILRGMVPMFMLIWRQAADQPEGEEMWGRGVRFIGFSAMEIAVAFTCSTFE